MNKTLLTGLLLVFLCAGGALARNGTENQFKIGTYGPEASDNGFIFGYRAATVVDEKVNLGISLDFYTKKNTNDEHVRWEDPNTGTKIDTVFTNFSSRLTMIPLMGDVEIRFPVDFAITPFVTGGLGYTMLWHKYDNYETVEGKTSYYGGFTWRLAFGGMYPLGSNSNLMAELFYNSSKPSRSEDTDVGRPVHTEIDMSGIGLRAGIVVHFQ